MNDKAAIPDNACTGKALAPIAIGALSLMPLAIQAASDTAAMAVSASVPANCTITAAALGFGAYDAVTANASGGADLTAQADLTVTCTNGAAATITLDDGVNANAGSSGTAPLRRMINGSNYLNYELYSDSARTLVWGYDATTDVAYTGVGTSETVTVYGSVPKGQNAVYSATDYTDTVTATITF